MVVVIDPFDKSFSLFNCSTIFLSFEILLAQIYLQQALQVMNEVGVAIDWTLANQAAIDWANSYAFNLVSVMRDGNQRLLQSAVSSYFDQGWTIGQLEDRIVSAFGPVRAEMIAVTEVTRAASEGEQMITRELSSQGIQMRPIWQTNNDALVCPICGPKHNKEIKDGVYPPAHPRCRCWVNHELPK